MSEPVAKRRPMIDLEEFERRLGRSSFSIRTNGAEPGEPGDLIEAPENFRAALAPQGQRLALIGENDRGPGAHLKARASERILGGDFSAIEAGLLGARREAESPNMIATLEDRSSHRLDPDGGMVSHLEHIPLGLNRSERQEYDQAFDSGAISFRPDVSIRPESALAGFTDKDVRPRLPRYAIGAVIMLGLSGIGASFALQGGPGSAAGPVQSSAAPAMSPPAALPRDTMSEAGVPVQDASIPPAAGLQPSPVALDDNAEQSAPGSLAEQETPRVIGLGETAPQANRALPAEAANVPVPAPESRSQVQAPSIAAPVEAKRVKTALVRPDGSLLPHEAEPKAAIPAEPKAVVPAEPSSAPRPAAATKAPAPKPAPHLTPAQKPAAAELSGRGQPAQAAKTNAVKPKPAASASAAKPEKIAEAPAEALAAQPAAPAANGPMALIQNAVNSVTSTTAKVLQWGGIDTGARP